MGYQKVVTFGQFLEYYQYENEINRKTIKKQGRTATLARSDKVLANDGQATLEQISSFKTKRRDNLQRSKNAFRRLVQANLGESTNPILASFTYAKSVTEIKQGHKDFNAFIKSLRYKFGNEIRYIAVTEFQRRGVVHFHALFWGLPVELVRQERRTRVVARLWGQGFVDLVETDGNDKLASYLAKYMAKSFIDPRHYSTKAYICSQNIKRPIVDKRAIGLMYREKLSTMKLLHEVEYMTQWLGKGRYQLYSN